MHLSSPTLPTALNIWQWHYRRRRRRRRRRRSSSSSILVDAQFNNRQNAVDTMWELVSLLATLIEPGSLYYILIKKFFLFEGRRSMVWKLVVVTPFTEVVLFA